jgi:cholera toxin transcriptional activator
MPSSQLPTTASQNAASPSRRAAYRFGLFELDPIGRELRKNGVLIKVQEQPFEVLVALLEQHKTIVTREQLKQRLWPPDTFVDFDHGLNEAVKKAREALGDDPKNPTFIETMNKRGYRFIAPLDVSPIPPVEPVRYHIIMRTLYGLLQLMYLTFYVVALWKIQDAGNRAESSWQLPGEMIQNVILVSGVLGIAIRLYTLAATAFGHSEFLKKHRILFPAILALDFLWALAPLLLVHRLGIGLAIASCAALFYCPFSQRMLVRMGWEDGSMLHRAPLATVQRNARQ